MFDRLGGGLKGTYLWESAWTDIPDSVYSEVLDKPYDINPIDWIEAYIKYDAFPQREKSFWCSALIACILTEMNVLEEDTDWSIVAPDFFWI